RGRAPAMGSDLAARRLRAGRHFRYDTVSFPGRKAAASGRRLAQVMVERADGLRLAADGRMRPLGLRPAVDVEMRPALVAGDEALEEQRRGDRARHAARGGVGEVGDAGGDV